jgi:hypothetical protein
MLTKILPATALLIALAGGALASDKPSPEMADKVRAVLTEQGYEVAKVEMEDGQYEAYARKDGKRYEVYLNAALEVVKVEQDD